MAITFVGSYVGTHAAITAQTVNFSNLRDEANATPTLQEGDLVLVAVENASTVDRTQAQLTPSGYTALHTDNYQNDSNDSNFLVSRKFMGSTPDTSVAIPASNATTAGVAYAIYVFRGVNQVEPMDATPVPTGNINTGVANASAIVPVTQGAWIVVFGGAAVAAGAVFTNPAGMSTTTNHFRSATITTTTNDANIGGAIYTAWTSGSYDPAAFGGSTSTNTGSWSAVTLALRPVVTHANTGTLTGQGSSVVGSANRASPSVSHSTSGALTGQGSTVAGSANRTRVHSSTAVLTGQGATITGISVHYTLHGTSGALSGQGASLSGTAARVGAAVTHTTSGVLVGQGSLLEGAAALPSDIITITGGLWDQVKSANAGEWNQIKTETAGAWSESAAASGGAMGQGLTVTGGDWEA